MERFNDAVRTVCDLLWNFPMLVLLAGTHLYFTIRLGFIQRKLPDGLRRSLSSAGSGGLSPYEALSTALAATIGTGNIVGVATAMVSGGPGALVWMWISALFGIIIIRVRIISICCAVRGKPFILIVMANRLEK